MVFGNGCDIEKVLYSVFEQLGYLESIVMSCRQYYPIAEYYTERQQVERNPIMLKWSKKSWKLTFMGILIITRHCSPDMAGVPVLEMWGWWRVYMFYQNKIQYRLFN